MKKALELANKKKDNEYYTTRADVETELEHYRADFNGSVILLNANDGNWSAFYTYFRDHWRECHLKKLISLSYGDAAAAAYIIDADGERTIPLTDDGSYDGECACRYADEADLIITNPPFSKMRDYLDFTISTGKKFLLLAPLTLFSYKNAVGYLVDGKVWCGITKPTTRSFICADGTAKKVPSQWITNLAAALRTKPYPFTATYEENAYEHFEERPDVINVNRVDKIPADYDGLMGVPITYAWYYCPTQYKVLGYMGDKNNNIYNLGNTYVNGVKKFARLVIQKVII